MPRKPRLDVAGHIYHVVNRAAGRRRIFETQGDYLDFERLTVRAYHRIPLKILAWCVMPNHWHFIVSPEEDGQMARFFGWLTQCQTIRWHIRRNSTGEGPIYQGRYKSHLVAEDAYCLLALRYVERNPVSAGLVDSADDWSWSSTACRIGSRNTAVAQLLSAPPISLPGNWLEFVNRELSSLETSAVETCIEKERPLGDAGWVARMCRRYSLESTLNHQGRPKKGTEL